MKKLLVISPIIGILPIQTSQIYQNTFDLQQQSAIAKFSEVYRTFYLDDELPTNITRDNQIDNVVVKSNNIIDSSQMHTEKYGSHETNDARYYPDSVEIDFQSQLYSLMNKVVQRGNEGDINHPGMYYTIYKIGFKPQLKMTWKEWHHQESSHEVYHSTYAWFTSNLDSKDLTDEGKSTGSPKNNYSTSLEMSNSWFANHLSASDKIDHHYFEDQSNPWNHHWNNGSDATNTIRIGFGEKLHSEFHHTYQEEDLYPSASDLQVNIKVYGAWVDQNWNPPSPPKNINDLEKLLNRNK